MKLFKDIKFVAIFLLVSTLVLIQSCSKTPSADEVWKASTDKFKNTTSYQFKYKQHQNNRLNGEVNLFLEGEVRYSKLAKSQYGFGFHTFFNNYAENIYNGQKTYKNIDHDLEVIWTLDASDEEAIKERPSLFADYQVILNDYEFEYISDTIVRNRKMFVYHDIEGKTSKREIRIERVFLIDIKSQLPYMLKKMSINNKTQDTLQILKTTLNYFKFSENEYNFASIDSSAFSNYSINIVREQKRKEVKKDQIKEGHFLKKSNYTDIDGNEFPLYGKGGKKTVIMFSFKDCGGCKLAMKAMSKRKFKIKKDLNFYYSNSTDPVSTIQPYLKEKQFPFPIFTKKSDIAKDFGIYSYPTFVLIDANGKIEKVISSYNKEVEAILF
ncbi:MAG: TlpA family protein disulfide reductase [Saprospiraceae bacterium]